jgi:TldD protein
MIASESTRKRAPLSEDLKSFQEFLPRVHGILMESCPRFYSSLYFERKSGVTASANLKQTQVSERATSGLVMRIYDGYTMHEMATDDLREDSLCRQAERFSKRIAQVQSGERGVYRPYSGASWEQRLKTALDDEILAQIPQSPTSSEFVHFGIRFKDDPRNRSIDSFVQNVKDRVSEVQTLAEGMGFDSHTLSFVSARRSFVIEESLFLDAHCRMSQTLFRNSIFVAALSGSNRTYVTRGGLGGEECVSLSPLDLSDLLRDLKGLEKSERLEPGKYRVIFGPVVSGVLAHEAFGHSQEGDTCARGRSKAWELFRSGDLVGNSMATILNNPAVFKNGAGDYAAWGSYFFDEEGWLAQSQVLLDQGKLLSPMTNLTSALRLGVPRTANGKRESWSSGVYTRQTNTYFSPGTLTLEQMMAELGDGFLALHPAGGMEDPKGMGIQVGLSYLQEVKDGKLTGRVFKGSVGGDIQMTGYVPDVLSRIVAKSKIEADHSGPDQAQHPFNDNGGCGKYHKEYVHAGCGGPYLLLDGVTLG